MISSSNAIERKAVDVSGRLGSLYDASCDCLRGLYDIRTTEKTHYPEFCICEILSGAQFSSVINFLKKIKFNDALLQSVRLGRVTPSGISSAINYNQPVDKNTFFFYYSYESKVEKLDLTDEETNRLVSALPASTNATHMITKILWGIEILCVIQVSKNQSTHEIDSLLQRISNHLPSSDKPLELTPHETRQIIELSNATVFGCETYFGNTNIPFLIVLNTLQDWQNNTKLHHPLLYTMQPLTKIYNSNQLFDQDNQSTANRLHIAQIESTITHLNECLKDLKQLFEELSKIFSSFIIHRLWEGVRERSGILLSIHDEFRTNLQKIRDSSCQDTQKSTEINNLLLDARYLSLKNPASDVFREEVEELLTKMKSIQRLSKDRIRYVDLHDVLRSQSILAIKHIDEILKNYLSNEDGCVIIWYSSDRLKSEQATEWEKKYQELISERQHTTQRTSLIYADFTHSQQKLEFFDIKRISALASPESRRDHSRARPSPPIPSARSPSKSSRPPQLQSSTSTLPSQKPPPPVTEINVLLLGETGVGKSTFINAFVNYLVFDTLQQAEQGEPIVLIPVSFLITTGDQFEEFIVKFGNVDSNENHENQGQSVTQQCKSYVFDLNERLRLRLIDTPGMGDTRGVDQDVKNIDHILTYINNLSHLNAICLLLKPNTSRLNIFFRSCVNQLLTYLTPIGYNNIIFCFTNARATFYAPGDTGPLLRGMLKQEHLGDIPFAKANTFCFDSESFRYLAARKRNVTFDEFQKQECIQSWITSMTESVRLLNFILSRDIYYLDAWQSPRKALLQISTLARPLMETLRLILYNWKLRETGTTNNRMMLNFNPVNIETCSNCAQSDIIQLGPFRLVEYKPVKKSTGDHCLCSTNEKHFLIEYAVQYVVVSQPVDLSTEELRNSFYNFLFKCDKLIQFLRQNTPLNQHDPFRSVIERFLDEERQIFNTTNKQSNMNRGVSKILLSLSQTREQNRKKLNESNERFSLVQTFQIIDHFKSVPDVNKQMENIQTFRQLKMKANEYQVNIPSTKNRNFAELTVSF